MGKTCDVCGQVFSAKSPRSRVCYSDECQKSDRARLSREQYRRCGRSYRTVDVTCRSCGDVRMARADTRPGTLCEPCTIDRLFSQQAESSRESSRVNRWGDKGARRRAQAERRLAIAAEGFSTGKIFRAGPCVVCAAPTIATGGHRLAKNQLCSVQCRETFLRDSVGGSHFNCLSCGAGFLSVQPAAKFCSAKCARRVNSEARRARKREAFAVPVNRKQIFDRDRWVCQLCRKSIDPADRVPHPLAATLDHIIPLASGGTHEPSNCQAAHFICNSRKGARGWGEQLLLLG